MASPCLPPLAPLLAAPLSRKLPAQRKSCGRRQSDRPAGHDALPGKKRARTVDSALGGFASAHQAGRRA
jgi:hypothetical protein